MFTDPLRSNTSDPVKEREITGMKVAAYGSMGVDGIGPNNYATVKLNSHNFGNAGKLIGKGNSGNWRCNDCFKSGSVELDEAAFGAGPNIKYNYHGNNTIIVDTSDSNHGWCLARVEISLCARSGPAIITAIKLGTQNNPTELSPLGTERVEIKGKNLGPILQSVSYGPDGYGFTVDVEKDCDEPAPPYDSISCNIRPGIGGPFYWKIAANKVPPRPLNKSVAPYIRYRNLGEPSLSLKPSQGIPTQGTDLVLSGDSLYLKLLSDTTSAKAGVRVYSNERKRFEVVGSAVEQFDDNVAGIRFYAPPLTEKKYATLGVRAQVYLRFTDPEFGFLGESNSATKSIPYLGPNLDHLIVNHNKTKKLLLLTAVGTNFGSRSTAGDGIICHRLLGGNYGACSDYSANNTVWTHTSIKWAMQNFAIGNFPGNVTVRVGNETHHLNLTSTLKFKSDPPTIVNRSNNDGILPNLKFPTQGSGTFQLYLDGIGDIADVAVYIGVKKTTDFYPNTSCTGECMITVTMPSGQGTNIPVRIEENGFQSANTVIIGGYFPPILNVITKYISGKPGERLGRQKDSVYNSESRPGVETSGQTVMAQGHNFGTSGTGGAKFEFCSAPFETCTFSRVACCENLWQESDTLFVSTASRNEETSNLTMEVPPGFGYDHLFRISVSGQKSNAIAIRYKPPHISAVLNQSLPTSSKDTDETPGEIIIQGSNFGAPGSVSADRYGDPVVSIGTRRCFVTAWDSDHIRCALPAGEGKDLVVSVKAGNQVSTVDGIYTYALPTITSMAPGWGSTDGTTTLTVNGKNFGTSGASVRLEFVRVDGRKFVVTPPTHSHTSLPNVPMPEGQGRNFTVRVVVSGQTSSGYIRPALHNLRHPKYSGFISLGAGDLYLPPLLESLSPTEGPTSGCDIWEELSVWKARYLLEGGSGRRCKTPVLLTLTGYSLGIGEALIEIFRDNVWEKIASDSDSTIADNSRSHTKISFQAPTGVGKDLKIRLFVGGKLSEGEVKYSFKDPNDVLLRPIPFSAQNENEPLEILSTDGFGETKTSVNVTIGSRECKNPLWNPIHRDSGRPYISCLPSVDVVGSKSISFNIAGYPFVRNARTAMEFNKSIVFSVCMAGDTDSKTGVIKSYYGRPCMGNISMQSRFHRSAPCVGQHSGKGELCTECPEGAFCYTPGTPWSGNTGEQYTYFDPTSKAGFWRLERALDDPNNVEDGREARLRVNAARWDPSFRLNFPKLHQKDFVFDFLPCQPSESCAGSNECAFQYRHLQEKCQAWESKNPFDKNCTSNAGCTGRGGGGVGECSFSFPQRCAVCDMDQATADGVGVCRCVPSQRCGSCTQAAEYSNGTTIPGHFKLDGECVECPENVPLLIFGVVCGLSLCLYGASVMERREINTSLISIGVDYFQVLAIFRNANIPWPPLLKQFYRFFAIFNLNIDVAAPECISVEISYTVKFWFTMLLPLIFLVVMLLLYVFHRYVAYSLCRTRYYSRPDWHSYISVYMILVYFMYLMLVRKGLQIFTCNPIVPSTDGFLYTTFTDVSCPYGLCRCYDPIRHEETKHFFQAQFIGPAWIFLILYGAGFPVTTYCIIMFNKRQIKTDQILRANNLGYELELSTKAVWLVRTSFKHLYYFFKPGKVYWILWIIYRKVAISFIAVLFYSNPGFQLAFTILVLFSAYVLQVRHRPFMSAVEMSFIRRNLDDKESDFHAAMRKLVKEKNTLKKKREKQRKTRTSVRTTRVKSSTANRSESSVRRRGLSNLVDARHRKMKSSKTYMFDYNSVELFMIGSAICVCATGIMFTSGNFENREDLEWQASAISVMVIALVIISIFYLFLALFSEITAGSAAGVCLKKFQKTFGGRKLRTSSEQEDEGTSRSFELALNPMHAQDDTADKLKIAEQEKEMERQRERNKILLERLKQEKREGGQLRTPHMFQQKRRKARKKNFPQNRIDSSANLLSQ